MFHQEFFIINRGTGLNDDDVVGLLRVVVITSYSDPNTYVLIRTHRAKSRIR